MSDKHKYAYKTTNWSAILVDYHTLIQIKHVFLENERDKSIRFDDNLFLVIECDFKTIVILPLRFLHWEQNWYIC